MLKKLVLEIENLSIAFGNKNKRVEVIHDISFTVSENEIIGIVGESGSGKSVTSLAIAGLLPRHSSQLKGSIRFENTELLELSSKEFQKIRGKEIAMIFQEPMSALNPSLTCGFQVSEIIRHHLGYSVSEAKKETLKLFSRVRLPRPKELYGRYPHQISGGQMQRVMIAMAIACKPKLLIADEPTTALDVTVQKEILQLLKDLQKETGMSLLFISHDLSLVSEIADKVLVMYQGNIVEQGSVLQIFKTPHHSYTRALLAARPVLDKRLLKLPTIASLEDKTFKPKEVTPAQRALRHKRLYTSTPLLEVKNVEKEYYSSAGLFTPKKVTKAVNDVSFSVFEGETLGLVGESGCGKSTLGKAILLLDKATAGNIKYRGKELGRLSKAEIRNLRKEIQLIFQDPFASLNPRLTIGQAILEPMKVHQIGSGRQEREKKVRELLIRVGLDESYFNRYPHELSGGQRQRVGIARTIALAPKLVICDESVSALDISVQAQVLNLLNELKEDFGFTYIFISHDLAVVKYMSDQLMVMNAGKIEEIGDADEIYANPARDYTKKLIDAIPKGI
ncbi:MAG: ABC transporter ATP-binding protein [Bacteroidia bacterium]|nr:ABC transporter ATP-binding protein [Bacteroidia bacterium]NNF31565.1 ABC transporter ATP-binding protein [Flavobacteriaceae bacterium]MBT8275640.1 ABC transporter ATP-binding protein [Bacteroidia bacterium]NNJ82395.1 ABC transporter ATP-binding protein [Flavobacteriaceae bacterium]NNK54144.1 ABC transporter ATP-binding protein [Flavobacteriaceae bacterium]